MPYTKIAIIPARSASKGLPNKNILTLIDRPLIAYTIQAAIESNVFDKIIVSTDSTEYKKIAVQYGAEVMLRNAELSSDTSTSFMVIQDVLSKLENKPDYFMLLQPTSPFRNAQHIKEAVIQFEHESAANYLVSVTESEKNSILIKHIGSDLSMRNFNLDYSKYRRQEYKDYYPNGAIFIAKTDHYLKKRHFFGEDSIAYFMSKKDSVDIDDQLDFLLAITLATKNNTKNELKKKIDERIKDKEVKMKKVEPITLLGHSIFDYWNIQEINGKGINNLGIAGISTHEYLELILRKKKISVIGDTVLLLSGTNDMVIEGWKKVDTLHWIEKTYDELIKINPCVKLFLLSVPPVRYRMDRINKTINDLNLYLKNNLNKRITFIDITSKLSDEHGNLKSDFTEDGLHFTLLAYKKIEEIITEII